VSDKRQSDCLTIEIDMGKRCVECGKGGAMQSGLCLKCTSRAWHTDKPITSEQAKAVRKRFRRGN
jgi:hypothetical protein